MLCRSAVKGADRPAGGTGHPTMKVRPLLIAQVFVVLKGSCYVLTCQR